MRILHLIHSEGVYGAERVLLYLAREQKRQGHVPLVGSIQDPGTAETAFEALAASWGLQVEPIRIAPRPTPGVVRALLRNVRKVQPDVLHSHGYKANVLLGPLPRSWRGPMLTTLHGWTQPRRLSALWLYEQLDRLALRRMDSVVVVSKHMLTLGAVASIRASRLRVIENGIPPLEVREADSAAHGVAPVPRELIEFLSQAPTLIAIGRLSREKGFPLLIEAFARARERARAVHQLLIVGEGPDRELLAGRVEAFRLGGIVRLAGYVEAADRLLKHAAGFVMSSVTEGLPLALLEAIQRRVPVLATSVGPIPELLDEGWHGSLVVPGDLAGLTQGLQSLMTTAHDSNQAVVRAFEAISTIYTSSGMAARYLDAYRAIR